MPTGEAPSAPDVNHWSQAAQWMPLMRMKSLPALSNTGRIVIAPDIAMPHAQGNTASVHQTAVSFMKVHEAVAFAADDRDKDARLFFTLASQNHEQHLENMSMLATMLDNEALIAELLTAQSNDDLRNIATKYGI